MLAGERALHAWQDWSAIHLQGMTSLLTRGSKESNATGGVLTRDKERKHRQTRGHARAGHGSRPGLLRLASQVNERGAGLGRGPTREKSGKPGQQAWASPGSWLVAVGPLAWASPGSCLGLALHQFGPRFRPKKGIEPDKSSENTINKIQKIKHDK